MALTTGTITAVATIKGNRDDTPLQAVLVLFTISGTYAQANGSKLAAVDAAIANNRRNGKSVTLVDATLYQPAADVTNATPGLLLCAKSIAISGSDITFNITESATAATIDVSTEFADGTALPSQGWPFGFLVTFYETTAS